MKRCLRWHRESIGIPPVGATDRDLFQLGAHLNGIPAMVRFDKRSNVLPT
jgi:hypothetical protein